MREAIGGTLLIQLVMFFIVIYVAFLAIAINYSITFRVKNQIITLIEEYEGYDNASDVINEYISKVGYYRSNGSFSISREKCANKTNNGYCIECLSSERGAYYKVTTFVSFDFPVIGKITNFPVSGETRVIQGLKCA